MNVRTSPRPRREHGYFLLESLIAVLIVALGVLGLIGLLAKSTQSIDESKYRGEASYLANAYVGQMWAADKATLSAHFSDSGGGAEYDEHEQRLLSRVRYRRNRVRRQDGERSFLVEALVFQSIGRERASEENALEASERRRHG